MKKCGDCIDYQNCFLLFGNKKEMDATNCDQHYEKKKHNCSDCKKAEFDCSPCNYEID